MLIRISLILKRCSPTSDHNVVVFGSLPFQGGLRKRYCQVGSRFAGYRACVCGYVFALAAGIAPITLCVALWIWCIVRCVV